MNKKAFITLPFVVLSLCSCGANFIKAVDETKYYFNHVVTTITHIGQNYITKKAFEKAYNEREESPLKYGFIKGSVILRDNKKESIDELYYEENTKYYCCNIETLLPEIMDELNQKVTILKINNTYKVNNFGIISGYTSPSVNYPKLNGSTNVSVIFDKYFNVTYLRLDVDDFDDDVDEYVTTLKVNIEWKK